MCEFRYGEAQPWEISLWEKDRSPFISTTLVTKGWSRKRCKYETWKLAFEHNAFFVLHDILESLSFVCFFNYILVTYLVGMLKINFMFFLERNKTWLIAEYLSISHPKAILYEAQGHQKNLSSAALGSSRWYVFVQFRVGGERFLQSAKHYKIRYSQANSAAGLTRCWHLTSSGKWDCRTPQGIFSPSC